MRTTRTTLALLAVVTLVVAGCGSTEEPDDGAAPTGDAAASTEVEIVEFAFAPAELTVAVGDTVTFTSRDDAAHTATGSGDSPIDSPDLRADDTYEVTFDEAGSYEYICKFHPFMTGTVTVEG